MAENKKYLTANEMCLKEAQTLAKKFEAELEAERLREASLALERVNLSQEGDPASRARLRANSLSLWLHLIGLLDRFLDPKFNIEDVPGTAVQPPPTSGGVVYPPGADPALIDDPKARADYEKAIAANRAKADRYRLQVHLRRVNERIVSRAEGFIRNAYTSAPDDQKQLRTAIEKAIKDPQRKAGLLKLLAPSECH